MINYDVDKIDKEHLKITLRYARKNDIYYDDEVNYDLIALDEGDVDDIIKGLRLLKKHQEHTRQMDIEGIQFTLKD